MEILKKSSHKLKNPVPQTYLDERMRPQDDFFQYACGGWIARNPIPPEEAAWGSFYESIRNNDKRLHALVKETEGKRAGIGTPAQLVRDFWRSGMDMQRRNELGFTPIAPYVQKIEKIDSEEALLTFIALAHKDGIGLAWGAGVGPDDRNADYNMLIIYQGGTSLPDRDYYLKDGDEYESVRKAYRDHVLRMLTLFGHSKEQAMKEFGEIMAFETRLARTSMTRVELRDPHTQYNPHSLTKLRQLAPHIDWVRYFALLGAKPKRVNVAQMRFIKSIAAMIETVPLSAWRSYLLWHVVNGSAPLLSKKAGELAFDFYGKTLQGREKQQPLWRRIIASTDGHIGDALGQLYVAKYFPLRAKRSIDELTKNIMIACAARIRDLDWMTSGTKRKALRKLAAIRPKVGYPDKWLSYKRLRIMPDDYYGNVIRTNRYEHARAMRKIDKRIDPHEWEMTPSTVNAYFHPNRNEIVFPAGILQPPFFDVDAPEVFNYGSIGSVIGHEITHAFDDEGRKFDEKGNLKDWWSKEDARRFEKRVAVLRRQYDAYEPLPGFCVNGKLTLGENIADLGGLLIAYDAWQLAQDKRGQRDAALGAFTPEQLFFFGIAVFEMGSIRDAALKKRLITDPHSPAQYRVNGPLANIDAFYEAFDVKKGDRLYISPAKRARIW